MTEGRRPITVYHGTSSILLRDILKNGVVPFPEKRVWGDDEDASEHNLSRVSMGGSYWSSDFMTAYGSGWRSLAKLGGKYRMVVVAQLMEQSAYADEDNVNAKLKTALGEVLSATGHSPSITSIRYLFRYFYGKNTSKARRDELTDIFRNALSKNLKEVHVLSLEEAQEIIRAFIIRSLAYSTPIDQSRTAEEAGLSPDFVFPSGQDAEHACWEIRRQLTKTFKKTAYRGDDAWHTLRIELPVKFSGANRIIAIAIFVTDEKRNTLRIEVPYGELPSEMLDMYWKSIGELPEIVKVGPNTTSV